MLSEEETAVPDDLYASLPVESEVEDQQEELPPAGSRVATVQREPRYKLRDVVSYFAPCGRCGYFLAGYRAANGLEDLETAVSRAKSGWVVLNWNLVVRELVLKSYACRIETNDLHYEGCCQECRRHFIFRASRSPNHPDTFRIELKPRKRQ